MKPFEKCFRCGGELVDKETEKLVRGGVNTAVLRVSAEVCLKCGERLYPMETVQLFESVRHKLENGDVDAFTPLGRSYQVV